MAETSGGLPVETTDSTPNEGALAGATTINVGNQKITTKGGLQGGALLKAMQDEYQSRMADSPMNRLGGFLESMKDAVAITSRDPGSAMAARDQEKRLKEESLFQMRAQMAALKGQMDQNAVIQNQLFGTPAPAGGTAAAPNGTVPEGAINAANTASNGLLNAVTDPNLRAQIALQYMSNPDAAMKQLNAHFAEIAKMPEVQKDVNYLVKSGLDPRNALQVGILKVVGSGAFIPHDVRSAAGTVQNTPFSAAGNMAGAPTPRPAAPAPAAGTPAPAMPRPAAPVAPSATPTAAGAPAPAALTPTAAAPRVTPAAPVQAAAPRVTPTAAPAPAAVARPAAPAPTAEDVTAGFRPDSSEAIELRKKAAESKINVAQKEGETAAGEAGKAQAQMNKLAAAANETMPAARAVLDIVEDPNRRHVAGYLHGNDPVATGLFTVAKHTSNKMPDQLEKEIIDNRLKGRELADYQTLGNSAQKLGIGYAADVFKGARMGIGLEKMAMGAKGVGPELMPEVNAKNARLIHDAAQFQLDKQAMWGEWSKSHGGSTASFDEFERTPQYVQFRDKARDHFINTYRGLVVPEANSPADRARAELERRRASRGTQ